MFAVLQNLQNNISVKNETTISTSYKCENVVRGICLILLKTPLVRGDFILSETEPLSLKIADFFYQCQLSKLVSFHLHRCLSRQAKNIFKSVKRK